MASHLKKKPTGWLRRALTLGVYQLMVQEKSLPAAVVSETVDFIKSKEGDAPAKFANALLRRIAEQAGEYRVLGFPGEEQAAAWASLPQWWWNKLVHQRGLEWAKRYAVDALERPEIWARAKADAQQDMKSAGFMPGPVEGSWGWAEGGAVPSWPLFEAGSWIVQDLSSQRLVREVAAALKARGLKRGLDLCSAPGGKAISLSREGIEVVASDRDAGRLTRLRENLKRTGAPVTVVSPEEIVGPFDWVWVDAPCSSSGIIRKQPDVKWVRQESEIQGLVVTQSELLKKGLSLVKPGGLLIYSVCSVFDDEGPRLAKQAKLGEPLQVWNFAPFEEPRGDGFWAAAWERSS